jgi:hypothetical protein
LGNEWAGAGQEWLAETLPCLFNNGNIEYRTLNIERQMRSPPGDIIRCSAFSVRCSMLWDTLSQTPTFQGEKNAKVFGPSRFFCGEF